MQPKVSVNKAPAARAPTTKAPAAKGAKVSERDQIEALKAQLMQERTEAQALREQVGTLTEQVESQSCELRELRHANEEAARREQTLARLLETVGVNSITGRPVDQTLAKALLEDGAPERVAELTASVRASMDTVQQMLETQTVLSQRLVLDAH